MKHTDFWKLKCRDCGSYDISINSDDEKTVTIRCNECGYFKKVDNNADNDLEWKNNRGPVYEFNTGNKPTEEELEIINKFMMSIWDFDVHNEMPRNSYFPPIFFAYVRESLRYAAEQSEGKVEYIEGEMF